MSGAPDQVSDDEVPIPHLHVTFPRSPSALAAATSPAVRDDEGPILRFSHHTALVSSYCDAEASPPCTSVSRLSSSTLLLFALNLLCRLAADALGYGQYRFASSSLRDPTDWKIHEPPRYGAYKN
jgi:hypothetical protein